MRNILGLALATFLVACDGGKSDFDASGMFEATEVIVSAEGMGKVMALDVEEGMKLEKGQVVGYIDTMQLYYTKKQLESSFKAVGSKRQDVAKQVAATRELIAVQTRELERAKRLVNADAANAKLVDDISAQKAVYERQLEAQLSALNNVNSGVSEESASIESQIERLRDQISKCVIQSPISGVVLTKYAEAGEVASAGRPLFKIADIDRMILRSYITSSQFEALKLGQSVTVFADFADSDNRKYSGEVIWISDKAEFTPKTIQTRDERANLVYAIKIAVKNDGYLKIGMYADVKFEER